MHHVVDQNRIMILNQHIVMQIAVTQMAKTVDDGSGRSLGQGLFRRLQKVWNGGNGNRHIMLDAFALLGLRLRDALAQEPLVSGLLA